MIDLLISPPSEPYGAEKRFRFAMLSCSQVLRTAGVNGET